MKNGKGYWLTPMDFVRDSFGRSFSDILPAFSWDQKQEWHPAVDISETKDSIVVKVELPGLSRDDIEIDVASGVLTIKGEKRFESEEEDRTWHRREVRYGSFSRSFSLPTDVKSDEAAASFSEGVLTVSLPKEEKAVHRKIEIGS
jgi:HSP20 family protein